jgi:FkbM family methyltransferase
MINFPTNEFHLFVDVGLAFNAPHTIEVLNSNPRAFVIGLEPNPNAIRKIKELNLGNRFHLLEAGASDVNESKTINIVEMVDQNYDPIDKLHHQGSSSFLEVTNVLKSKNYQVVQKEKANLIRLEDVLDQVPWHLVSNGLFDLKSDTQGYEDKVILGLGKYISRVRFLQIEVHTHGYYEGASNHNVVRNLLNQYLIEVGNDGGNAWFLKKS